MNRRIVLLIAFLLLAAGLAGRASARTQMDIERYSKLREAERYQIDVADQMFDKSKWPAALKEYEKYLKLYGIKSIGTPYAQLRIAQCLENSRNINQAIREYKALVKIFPESPDAITASLAIGRCYYGLGDTNGAIEAFSETVTKFAKDNVAAEALEELAKLQEDKAVAYRMQIVDDYPKSRLRDNAARWVVDHYLYAEKNTDAARTVYRKIASEVKTEEYLGRRLYERGSWLFRYRRDQRDEAVRCMDEAIAIYKAIPQQYPAEVQAVEASERMIALCYKDSGRNDEAVVAFRAFLKTHPEDDAERRNYGLLLEDMDRWGEARIEYSQFKNASAGARELAESYYRQKKVKEAEDAYMNVVQQYPDFAKWALYRAGDLHLYISRDFQKAVTFYQRSEYNAPQYLFMVGRSYEQWGKWTEAITTYGQIRNFFKTAAPNAMRQEIEALEHRKQDGDLNLAIRLLKALCDTYPKSGEASWAHQRLESTYNIPYTGGGMDKGE